MEMPRYLRAIGQTSAQFFQSLVPGFEDRRAGELKATRDALERAEAYVDPSRLMASKLFVPYNPSVLVTRKGLSIFDQMKRDEQIKSCLMFKKHAILSPGWEIKSPGDQEEDWEVTEFVRDTFLRLPGGMDRAVRKILLGLDYGYSVTEKIYGDAAWAPGKKPLIKLTSVKPHYFDFEMDPFGNVLSLIQRYVPGLAQEVFLPTDKFVVYQNEPEFENPYGTSDLEAAYRAWWVKDNAYKWFAVLLERYGMPPLFLFYNPNNYSGNQLEELKKVVRNIQNSTMGLLPRQDKDALEFWSAKLAAEGKEVYLAALSRFDQDIGRALLMPSLIGATSDDQSGGNKGSYARANVHFKNFLYVVGAAQRDVASNAINSQIIPQLVDLNFAGVEHYPEFTWGRLDDELELTLFDTWQKLVEGKVVNRIEDDETHIRKSLGFPENDEPVLEPLPEKGSTPDPKDKKKTEGEPIPEEEQSAEMKAFAEENGGEWWKVDGEAVCVEEAL